MRQSYSAQRRYDEAFSRFELMQRALGTVQAREQTFAALRIQAVDTHATQQHHRVAIDEIAKLILVEFDGMAVAALSSARLEVLEAGEALARLLKVDALDIKGEERKKS